MYLAFPCVCRLRFFLALTNFVRAYLLGRRILLTSSRCNNKCSNSKSNTDISSRCSSSSNTRGHTIRRIYAQARRGVPTAQTQPMTMQTRHIRSVPQWTTETCRQSEKAAEILLIRRVSLRILAIRITNLAGIRIIRIPGEEVAVELGRTTDFLTRRRMMCLIRLHPLLSQVCVQHLFICVCHVCVHS